MMKKGVFNMQSIVVMSTMEAIKYLNYHGPVQLSLKPLKKKDIEIWGQKMKMVDFK